MQNKCNISETSSFYHGFNNNNHNGYELNKDYTRKKILSALSVYNDSLLENNKDIVTEDEFMRSAEHKMAAFNLLKDIKEWRELFSTTLENKGEKTIEDLILEDINNTEERDLAIKELLIENNEELEAFLDTYLGSYIKFTAIHAIHIFNNIKNTEVCKTDLDRLKLMHRLIKVKDISAQAKVMGLAGSMTEEVQNIYDNLEGTDLENLKTMKSVCRMTIGAAKELAKDLFGNMIHEVENILDNLNGTNIENLKTMNKVWKVIRTISNEAPIRIKGESMIGDMTKEVNEIYKNLEGTSEEKVELMKKMSGFLIKGKAKDRADKLLEDMDIEGVEIAENILKKDFPNGIFEKFEKLIATVEMFAYNTKSHNAVVALFRKQTQLVQDFFDALTGTSKERIEKMHEFTYLIGRCDPQFGAGDVSIKAHKLLDSMTKEVQEVYDSFRNKEYAIRFLKKQSFLKDSPVGELLIKLRELDPETRQNRLRL